MKYWVLVVQGLCLLANVVWYIHRPSIISLSVSIFFAGMFIPPLYYVVKERRER